MHTADVFKELQLQLQQLVDADVRRVVGNLLWRIDALLGLIYDDTIEARPLVCNIVNAHAASFKCLFRNHQHTFCAGSHYPVVHRDKTVGIALLVQHVQSDILKQILPLLVIGIGLYFLLMPKLGEADRQRRLYGLPFALVAGGSVGFYDGFFGPGAGSFYALAFVTLAGFNLAKSTAHAKLLNATSNVGGLLLFIIGGALAIYTSRNLFLKVLNPSLAGQMDGNGALGSKAGSIAFAGLNKIIGKIGA